jgi:hypothetical protein
MTRSVYNPEKAIKKEKQKLGKSGIGIMEDEQHNLLPLEEHASACIHVICHQSFPPRIQSESKPKNTAQKRIERK